ncbi:iron ABC transporter permease [Methanospirillum sp. J.3.6.1-F.2.7.3]|uniref:Cobalamin import system permease protein BtuC n=1 Tax=Methanospirillum purgamenti TaxID=2834276 RepID=A0A8E7B1T8_9EURY|nr:MULTISPECIES: iron ABC transporter permease [Methanospirillum]MDX8549193.1 iron ABC transporter permease [Methanospirillum hungatei]QVV88862.1 iron ABC transporter permease [Methanospirillum sp. J.3.6.1-F.2.7.3]
MEDVKSRYHAYIYTKYIFILVCFLLLLGIIGISMSLGSYGLSFIESYQVLLSRLLHLSDPETVKEHVIMNIRLPRIIGGILAGIGLAVAGSAMQGIMKNPLADPYTTGISTGAGFGAAVAIIGGIGAMFGDVAIILNAFIFSLIPMFVIMSLSKMRKPTPSMMILAGIATMYIFSAMTTLMMISADANDVQSVYMWTVGTLDKVTWDVIPYMLISVAFGCLLLVWKAKELNVMSIGDEGAVGLGVNVEKTRKITLFAISITAATIVSFTGVIGFVGMISPHVVRMFLGSDHRYLIPASGLFGATLLMMADGVARTIVAPTILPVGVITAFIGGPLFLYLIICRKKEIW